MQFGITQLAVAWRSHPVVRKRTASYPLSLLIREVESRQIAGKEKTPGDLISASGR